MVKAPQVVVLNHRLADELGLSLHDLSDTDAAALFSGQQLPPGAHPIAQAYAGHQFGGFTMLGDGRAMLWGEQRTPDGRVVDLQFKGSGQTPFSRRGDGYAALGPMLREFIISEALQSLGIPTTRSLAVVTTGQPVYRESMLKGAILTRVAASHLRVGTFEYIAARNDEANLRVLADYAIARHYSDLSDGPEKYLQFLKAVVERQAALIAKWQLVGFVHGVMNTDNMAISGESIDFGPCAFMDTFHPQTVFSSIDQQGRYAYANQPNIGQWNLARFAESLLPLLHRDDKRAVELAMEALNEYPGIFKYHWLSGMRHKLGLTTTDPDDEDLIRSLLEWMTQQKADFTNTFDDLSMPNGLTDNVYQQAEFQQWVARWKHRLEREGLSAEDGADSEASRSRRSLMQSANPAVIPRNHHVEAALEAASERDDLSVMEGLVDVLHSPFERSAKSAEYRNVPTPSCRYRTFCGT